MYDCEDIRMIYKYLINNFTIPHIALIERTPCSELAAARDQAVKNVRRDPRIETGRGYGAADVPSAPRYKYLHLYPLHPVAIYCWIPGVVEVLPPSER